MRSVRFLTVKMICLLPLLNGEHDNPSSLSSSIFQVEEVKEASEQHLVAHIVYDLPRPKLIHKPVISREVCHQNVKLDNYCTLMDAAFEDLQLRFESYLQFGMKTFLEKYWWEVEDEDEDDDDDEVIHEMLPNVTTKSSGRDWTPEPDSVVLQVPLNMSTPYFHKMHKKQKVFNSDVEESVDAGITYLLTNYDMSGHLPLTLTTILTEQVEKYLARRLHSLNSVIKRCESRKLPSEFISWKHFLKSLEKIEADLNLQGLTLTYPPRMSRSYIDNLNMSYCFTTKDGIRVVITVPIRRKVYQMSLEEIQPTLLKSEENFCLFGSHKNVSLIFKNITSISGIIPISPSCDSTRKEVCRILFGNQNQSESILCSMTSGQNNTSKNETKESCDFFCVVEVPKASTEVGKEETVGSVTQPPTATPATVQTATPTTAPAATSTTVPTATSKRLSKTTRTTTVSTSIPATVPTRSPSTASTSTSPTVSATVPEPEVLTANNQIRVENRPARNKNGNIWLYCLLTAIGIAFALLVLVMNGTFFYYKCIAMKSASDINKRTKVVYHANKKKSTSETNL